MSTPLSPFVTPEAALPSDHRATLLGNATDDSPAFVALFKKPSLAIVYLNSTARHWLDPEGHSSLTDLTLHDIIGVSGLALFQKEMIAHVSVLGKWQGDWMLRDIWGSELAVAATVTSHAGVDGHETGFLCLQATQTAGTQERKDTMTSDHHLLHALMETLPDAVYFKDLHSRFIRVSRALAIKDGVDNPAAFIGLTDFDRFTAEHARPAYEAEQKVIETGEPLTDLEEKETWPDGHVTWVTTTKLPLRDPKGKIVGTFGISRDITARKLAEQNHRDLEIKYQLAQKLESIGRLAAGVAHEINTPTQFITDNIHFLTKAFNEISSLLTPLRSLRKATAHHADLADQARIAETMEQEMELDYLLREIPATLSQTAEGLGRVTRIVHSLKEFSHPNSVDRSPVDLNRVIETAITVSRHEWKYVAEVITDLSPALPSVPCIVDEFNQVMLNLIINAAHAIESVLSKEVAGSKLGTITIRTRHDGTHAVIEVEDTGAGIPTEIRDRVFDPFFTTKAMGKGTGQGLAIVYKVVVKNHCGSVDFTSEVGRGTVFRLRLPLATTE